MDFTKTVETFLDANPRLSRDERNLKMIVDFILSQKLTITLESAPILLEQFVRQHHDELLWLAEEKSTSSPATMWAKQNKGYSLYEQNQQAAAERAKKRENVQKNAELLAKRAEFERLFRNIKSHREMCNLGVNWADTFNEQRSRYASLANSFPMWSAECEAAAAKVGR
jgi:hypothetical protein